jgi:hypothetical protein
MLIIFLFIGSLVALWVWMFIDLISRIPVRRQVLWAAAFTLGTFVGAVAYFIVEWRPRVQTSVT